MADQSIAAPLVNHYHHIMITNNHKDKPYNTLLYTP